MSGTIAFAANALSFPWGGGHVWAYLNWALGMRAAGYRILWIEGFLPSLPIEAVYERAAVLRTQLHPYDVADGFIPFVLGGTALPSCDLSVSGTVEEYADACDLLVSLQYHMPDALIRQFRRSALIDIDPGLLQVWAGTGQLTLGHYDQYFSIGETVGTPAACFPDCGVSWHYTPPPVSLEAWPALPTLHNGRYTTISNWYAREWLTYGEHSFSNDKRVSFLDYVELPAHTSAPLELALSIGPGDAEECRMLEQHGWNVRDAQEVAGTPGTYRSYIQQSRGEFSCAKPSCMHLQNAWISDRTLCYLASGKPAIVQDTGPSRFLPRDEGLLRFASLEEAACALTRVEREYERHCRAARALAEEHFDARIVAASVLERALA